MSKKLHIKTWGCQMNEYDSSKMADLLDASNGYTLTEEPSDADVPAQYLLHPREGPGEGVPPARSLEEAQGEEAGAGDGVGGCVALRKGTI